MSDDRLAALSAAGVSIWLDDLDRARLAAGGLAALVDRVARRRASRRTRRSSRRRSCGDAAAYADQVHDLAIRGVDLGEAVRALTTYDVRWACDVLAPVYTASRRRRRPGEHRGRPAARARHRGDDRRGQGAALVGRPAQRAHQDPGHRRGPARDHRPCSAPGISVNVTLIFSVDRYRGRARRLARRARAGAGQRARPRDDRVGRVVLRQPRRLRGRQAALGADSPLRGTAAIANARVAHEAFAAVLAARALEGAGRGGRARAAPAVGLDRREGPGVQRHPLRRSTWSPPTSSTRCPRPRSTRSATTARSPATRSCRSTPRRTPPSTRSPPPASTSTTSCEVLEDEGVEKFVASWEQLLASVTRPRSARHAPRGR